jgi:hypothetical protein
MTDQRSKEEILLKAIAYYEDAIRWCEAAGHIDEKKMAHEPMTVARKLLWSIGVDYSELETD